MVEEKIVYDFGMIRTVARCLFIYPKEYKQTGYDWSIKQREWETLNDDEKLVWYDKAINWLESLKLHMPNAYQFYIENWMPDQQFLSCVFTDES